jgi:hypothetical protein
MPLLRLENNGKGFEFSVSSAAYNELSRTATYEWSEQKRVGTFPALQFTGKDSETITLKGVVFPAYTGGLEQINRLRDSADQAIPYTVVGSSGNSLGRWVIVSVSETQSNFLSTGEPRKQTFNLDLKYYDNGKN